MASRAPILTALKKTLPRVRSVRRETRAHFSAAVGFLIPLIALDRFADYFE
jgi:hypothetical protein